MRMEGVKKKMMVAVLVVMVLFNLESVEADAGDCYDACTTACVQPNSRLQQRCEIKCGIKCDFGSQVTQHVG